MSTERKQSNLKQTDNEILRLASSMATEPYGMVDWSLINSQEAVGLMVWGSSQRQI